VKFIPAIDLKDGKCVRLTKGKSDSSVIFNSDPIKQAKFFENEGCERIHIVDLDAAFEKKNKNRSLILDIRNSISIEIQMGGGIRTKNDISFWIKNGIDFVIVGSIAIKYQKEFKDMANCFPNKLYVSLDDLDGKAMTKGWTESSNYTSEDILSYYNNSKIKGIVYTDVNRDGMLQGINIDKLKKCLDTLNKPVIVSGGLSTENDLINLINLKNKLIEGVIAGKSFYTGKINIKNALRIIK
tara:strand:- start:240 stop:962 length:723 start_codon:yes stop_codon:yes gene_type:complete